MIDEWRDDRVKSITPCSSTDVMRTTPLLNFLGVRDYRGRGFATGVAAHGIGTARAFQVHGTAGAFASIGMVLNAILTALIAPILVKLVL